MNTECCEKLIIVSYEESKQGCSTLSHYEVLPLRDSTYTAAVSPPMLIHLVKTRFHIELRCNA